MTNIFVFVGVIILTGKHKETNNFFFVVYVSSHNFSAQNNAVLLARVIERREGYGSRPCLARRHDEKLLFFLSKK